MRAMERHSTGGQKHKINHFKKVEKKKKNIQFRVWPGIEPGTRRLLVLKF